MLIRSTIDMFRVNATIRINPVNCVGVMGKGLALEFKNRYPMMFKDYQQVCRAERLTHGGTHIWQDPESKVVIINVATKNHWRDPSDPSWVAIGLSRISDILQAQIAHQIVTLPALGCGLGGLEWKVVWPIIENYLKNSKHDIFYFPPQE